MQIKNLDKWILPVYQPYMRDYHTRLMVFYGGAGSGKSYFITQKLCIKLLKLNNRKLLVVRKVGATLRDSAFAVFVDVLNKLCAIKNINKTDLTIELINGNIILFKGMDSSEKLKSISQITDIFVEECTELSIEDFSQLNLRLRSKEPFNQIHIAFNPVSKANFCYKYFFENGAPDDCKIIQTTYKDNPKLPKEYVNSLKELEKRNPAYFKIYVKGEFATLDKLVFPIIHKRIISPEEYKDWWFWVGLDWGYTNDPTAITWGYYNPVERKLFITGEYDKIGMTNDEISETLEKLGLSKERVIADSAEPKSIEELRRLGIKRIRPSVKGPDSVMNGIDKMQRCEIVIDERCTKTIEEFENYTWEKDRKSGEYINRPVDSFNHHIDSIRYGLQAVIGKKHLNTEDDYYRGVF